MHYQHDESSHMMEETLDLNHHQHNHTGAGHLDHS